MTELPAPPAPPRSRLTRLEIRNFKRFESVEIELDSPVVFVGPNNSGKTSALQALALWRLGVRRWVENGPDSNAPEPRLGATVGRRDLLAAPVPSADALWRDLRVRETRGANSDERSTSIPIEIVVSGDAGNGVWTCGLAFDYANEESFYCRPVHSSEDAADPPLPKEAAAVRLAFLPPMSGLIPNETLLGAAAVNVRIGEGRTAEVLRNQCFRLHDERPEQWDRVTEKIARVFGTELAPPRYDGERGEIELAYRERGTRFDISASGRGCQQTLLLLSFLSLNPGSVLLLDEPDAHLESLRQRQVYDLLSDAASETGSQLIAVTRSEVLLDEAAGRDTVISFAGRPHRIGRSPTGIRRALREIEFRDYALAEQVGWMLYIEGPTDLAILRAFAERLGHTRARQALEAPFARHVGNFPKAARRHFHGIRAALPTVRGVALFDRLKESPRADEGLRILVWQRREIENYFCSEAGLLAFAAAQQNADTPDPFAPRRVETMRQTIEKVRAGLQVLNLPPLWSHDAKASTDVLEPILSNYYAALGQYNEMPKRNLHRLVQHLPEEEIPGEVREKLDAIAETYLATEGAG